MPDAVPVQQSLLHWFLLALGWRYTILLSLAGLLSFVLTLIVVLRGKGPLASASLVLIVHVPLLIGVYAAIDGLIRSYTVIAMSEATVKASEVATGISTALVAPLVGMILMVPGYATAALGSLIRSLGANAEQGKLP